MIRDDIEDALAVGLVAGDSAKLLRERVLDVLLKHNMHPPVDCPECTERHCPNERAHAVADDLEAAVQSLHSQAHNGPRDTLDASRCMSDPCRSVA